MVNFLMFPKIFSCYFLFLAILLLSSPCIIHSRNIPNYTFVNSQKDQNTSSPITKTNRHNTWHEFRKFRYATKGDFVDGISKLKNYLNHFGYLESQYVANSTDLFDENLEVAIKRYQAKLGLPISGNFDKHTLSELVSPRCGVPDVPKTLHATKKYAFFTGRPRWGRIIPMMLTYAFSPENTIASPKMEDVRGAFQRAFGHWASVIPATFVESDEYPSADIKIGFYSGDHGDGEAFDGVLGVLAHAYSPENGQFHLDAAETWAVDFALEKSESAVDLESVATHEIGHLLGLAHTDVKEAAMYPSLKPRTKKLELKLDDIKGVQALYGSNPDFRLEAFSESDMSSNDAFSWTIGPKITCFNWLLILILWLV